MHSSEKPIILIVTTLFLAFTLVYMMFFRIRDTSTEAIDNGSGGFLSGALTDSGLLNSDSLILSLLTDSGSVVSGALQTGGSLGTGSLSDRVVLQTGDEERPSSGATMSGLTALTGSSQPSLPSSVATQRYKRIAILSGATPWYNSVKIAETLGLDVSVVFNDTGSILYAYLGTGELKTLAASIQRLQGNILAIDTEIDINKNGLPGDRVRFINIPQLTFVRANGVEQKLLVAMIVTIDDDQWLIQAPYDVYHASKKRMIQIFNQLYK